MSHNFKGSSGNLVLISSQTASNSASILFTSGISGFDIYFLRYYGIINANNNVVLKLQFSTDGGSSYSSTGYTSQGYFNYSGGLTQNPASASVSGGYLLNSPDNTSSTPGCGEAHLYNLNNASFNKYCMATEVQYYGAVPAMSQIFTVWATTTSVNAIKILAESGNITSGTFKLYGVQN